MAEAPKTHFSYQDIPVVVLRYLDSDLSEGERDALREQLASDAESANQFVECVELACLVREQARRAEGLLEELLIASDQNVTGSEVLQELLRLENEADAQLVHELGQIRRPENELWRVGGALHWMVNRPAVWGAIAAAIAMNVVLVVVLLSGSGEGEPIADQGAPAYELEKQMPAIVATLTAERRAVWDRRPGEDLYAGQRFTLTQGFAEITTARGAVAILEAPAKIELSDNNNAIWLHAGKLVGICETDSSKGFLVRTPRMDVADLGTRFGVDVAHTGSTEVHVLEGVVAVSKPDARTGGATLRLAAGESARAADSDLEIVRIDQDTARFAALLLYAVPLPGTGQGLALGETDSNWRVTAIDGEPLDPPGTMAVRDAHDDYAGPPFLPNDPQTSQWLLIDRQLGQSGTGPVTFTCQGRFELPSDVDPSEVRLVVSFDADDAATAIRLNGHPVAVPENEFEDGSRDLHVMTIRRHLVAGQNTIEFDVMDPRSAGAAVSGLRVKLSLRSIGQRDP